jgi:hypothetical protein
MGLLAIGVVAVAIHVGYVHAKKTKMKKQAIKIKS